MKNIISVFFILLFLNAISMFVKADIDVYNFSSDDKLQVYQNLTKELRCPKCQNQDIKDSNAPIAQDMRREVHRMVEEGKSHDQIIEFMVERFGEFVTYTPKIAKETYVLWYGPIAFVLIGLIAIGTVVSKKKKQKETSGSDIEEASSSRTASSRTVSSQKASTADEEKIKQLISQYDQDK